MDSINQRQPEHNHEDLTGVDAVRKLKQIVHIAGTCFFCTSNRNGGTADTRPMRVLQTDDEGNLWFLSADDSHKNQELEANPSVELFFQGAPNSDYLHVRGIATVSRDKAKIHELWNFALKTWFTGGEDDPRITVIKVRPTDCYYWDTKHGNIVAGVKILIGAAIGKTLDDSIEGSLKV
ncbi:MAG: pyridoxamine 5'-phosphate oxidase family protein [Gammaproteobacteria bacterium]